MKTNMNLSSQTLIVISYLVLLVAGEAEHENRLTKLWSVSGAANSVGQRTAVLNVTSATVIDPSNAPVRSSRQSKMADEFHPYNHLKVGFKPRAIPLRRDEPQVERSIHYVNDEQKKSEILFPGNYFPIAEVERENEKDSYNPMAGGPFQPVAIPLLRELQRRSLDREAPVVERPEGYVNQEAQRRSISSYFAGEELEEEDEDFEDDEEDELKESKSKGSKPKPHKLKAQKKYAKYMLPLLLAYKMKFFAMIPVMIGGLVLLVGATGLAGFFFALFAAVMGLQKGSY